MTCIIKQPVLGSAKYMSLHQSYGRHVQWRSRVPDQWQTGRRLPWTSAWVRVTSMLERPHVYTFGDTLTTTTKCFRYTSLPTITKDNFIFCSSYISHTNEHYTLTYNDQKESYWFHSSIVPTIIIAAITSHHVIWSRRRRVEGEQSGLGSFS